MVCCGKPLIVSVSVSILKYNTELSLVFPYVCVGVGVDLLYNTTLSSVFPYADMVMGIDLLNNTEFERGIYDN